MSHYGNGTQSISRKKKNTFQKGFLLLFFLLARLLKVRPMRGWLKDAPLVALFFFSLFSLFKRWRLSGSRTCVCVNFKHVKSVMCECVFDVGVQTNRFSPSKSENWKKIEKDWKVRWDVLLLTGETHRPGHEGVGAIVFTQSEGVQYWEWIWKVLNYWSFFPPLLLNLFPLLRFSSQNKHARLVFTWGRKRARISFKQKLEGAR